MLSHFTSGTKCVFFSPHQPVLQCSVDTSWVSYESRPFWHRPAGRGVRLHSRRAQAPKATPVSAISLWLFPWPPPLALWFVRMANTFLMFTCLIWRPELRNSQREEIHGQGVGGWGHGPGVSNPRCTTLPFSPGRYILKCQDFYCSRIYITHNQMVW